MGFAAVQRVGKGVNAASLSIGSGDGWAAPTSGNLLVVTANSDATVTITGTWNAGPSVVDGNGAYMWWRISNGTETTITLTPSVSDTITGTVCEYSGNAASPLDASNSSTIAASSGTTTTATSVTTTASGDLIVVAALLHAPGASAPTSPTWTNSFANQLSANTGGTGAADTYTFLGELIAGAAGSYSTSASWTNAASDRQQIIMAFTAAAAPATIPPPPVRTVAARDPGEAWWLQRDRRDANTVGTAANPLPSPLDSAWQSGARYWHLYGDTADAAPRTWQSLQRMYISDPNLLAPAVGDQNYVAPRTAQIRDPGETYWQQGQRRDPLLLTTALLENELLGGADTAKRYNEPATHAPRWWMPQQPPRVATTPGLLDSALLETPLLGGADDQRHRLAAAYYDRREVPQQRSYISDPSFYPTTAPTDPLTVAWGAGGPLWWLYNTAAAMVDRREVPQQRRYISDPALLLSALLENELLGSADDLRRHYLVAAYLRPTTPPGRSAATLPGAPDADPLTFTSQAVLRAFAPAYADRREVPAQPPRWTLYFDAGPDSPPLTLSWGAGGNLWHLYNDWRRVPWLPHQQLLAIALAHDCFTHRPNTGTTVYDTTTTARPDAGITEAPCQ